MKLYFAPGACSFVPPTLLETAGEPFDTALVKPHKGENDSDDDKAREFIGRIATLPPWHGRSSANGCS